MVVVPFDPDLDLIYLLVDLSGPRGTERFRFALDTACAETLVIPEAIEKIGYSARNGDSITTVTTALGREQGYRLRVSQMFALGHRLGNCSLHVHDLPEDSGLDGLLGLSFLRQFNYEVRSREGRILVQQA